MSDIDQKLREIKQRHERDARWLNGPSMISPQSHEDRAFLLEEIERLRDEVDRLRAERRERIATGCLAVMLSLPDRITHSDAARIAVSYSDALLAELDRETAP